MAHLYTERPGSVGPGITSIHLDCRSGSVGPGVVSTYLDGGSGSLDDI